ncbi:hypothetical protein KJS94_11215 [Flavihumibacter rivuli]|uniref:hypothetical protein n=1 Tax=Flavihumibacter rivuli TaxID=2838156 RepID=UPI001BDF5A6C|nr:hypothetical protein [Flavihumibacter rivuli]ULQ55211.1 hypothetical protein KJS94_11215 [Flavihumibacter rivuli]
MKKILLAAVVAATVLTACEKDKDKTANLYKGPEQAFHNGKSYAWIQTDKQGNPEKLGLTIDAAAYNSLPAEGEGHNHSNSLSLKFAQNGPSTLFTHVLLDWNPEGHEPEGVYDLPHFDFHFYLQSEAERQAIPVYEQAAAKFDNHPEAGYTPDSYIAIPGGVPQMGVHWVDLNSPEMKGEDFTQTFLYGSYDGKVTFYEPMITKAFIDQNPSFERSFPLPAKFKATGYYPTKMKIRKENGSVHITLENFVLKQAS